MKKYFISVILTILTLTCFSQKQRDAVYLKNGGLVYGNIIEIIPDSTLKIQTADGSTFIFKMNEVEKITKEIIHKSVKKDTIPKEIIKKGYKGFFSGYKGFNSIDLAEFNTTHGIQKTPNLFFGGGIAIISIDNGNPFIIPIFNTRFNFRKENYTPFVDLKIGYGIFEKGGIHVNPSFGFRLGNNIAAFNCSVGYMYNEGNSVHLEKDDENYRSSIFYIGLGVEF